MYSELLTCGSYEVSLKPILSLLKNRKIKSFLIHAPNGLKHIYTCLSIFLQERGFEVYVSAAPGYGSCDIPLDEAEALGVGGIIHVGHEKYELTEETPGGLPILYLPVYYKGGVSERVLGEIYSLVKEKKYLKLTISSTLTDVYSRRIIRDYLVERGVHVFEVEKPILGCLYGHVLVYDGIVDAHLVVAGGVFHALGLGLVSTKPVLAVDPYMSKVWNASVEAFKVLKQRLFKIYEARSKAGRKLGLIIGSRLGQYRPKLARYIEEEAIRSNYIVYKITAGYVDRERLIAIDDALKLDLYVVTNCPRLPIDDLGDFYKPVLTPGEFLMLTRGIEKYVYPW